MPDHTIAEQNTIKEKLKVIFPDLDVKAQWLAEISGVEKAYSPTTDVSVGPFAIENQFINDYDKIVRDKKDFFESLIKIHNLNLGQDEIVFDFIKNYNNNSRCLLAIELENKTVDNKKHVMGSIINAASLGRFGLLVPIKDDDLVKILQLRKYIDFLGEVKDRHINIMNCLIVSYAQFVKCLDDFIGSQNNSTAR